MQVFHHVLVLAVQKGDDLVQHLAILSRHHVAGTGRKAQPHLVSDAGTVLAAHAVAEGKLVLAGAQREGIVQHFQHVAHHGRADVRSEVLCAVLFHAAHQLHARVVLL